MQPQGALQETGEGYTVSTCWLQHMAKGHDPTHFQCGTLCLHTTPSPRTATSHTLHTGSTHWLWPWGVQGMGVAWYLGHMGNTHWLQHVVTGQGAPPTPTTHMASCGRTPKPPHHGEQMPAAAMWCAGFRGAACIHSWQLLPGQGAWLQGAMQGAGRGGESQQPVTTATRMPERDWGSN